MKDANEIKREKMLSIGNFGAGASLIIGILYLAIGILLPIDPAEKYRGTEFYNQIAAHPFIPHLWRYIFVIVGFLTLIWITTAITYVREKSYEWEGFYRWVSIIGYIGCIMTVVEWMRELFAMKVMTLWSTGNEMYRIACEVAAMPVDPDFVWKFGGLGLWYLVTCLLAQRCKVFTKGSNILGMVIGIDLILTMVFGMADTIIYMGDTQMTVMQITALLGGILGAIYHIRMFFVVRKVIKTI